MSKSDWNVTVTISGPEDAEGHRESRSDSALVSDSIVRGWAHPAKQVEFREWLGRRCMGLVQTMLDPAAEAHRVAEQAKKETKAEREYEAQRQRIAAETKKTYERAG